jgi:NCS1 family nucleobase:cation symporter-1
VSTVTERLERVLDREAPVWGIRPVPPEHRRLSGLDLAVLWGDLSLGLLVIVTGALLVVLGMSLPRALLAIVVGSAIGCVPLALVGSAGAREGVPTMVLFRPVLGVRGSWIPSALNLLQLVGWAAFELWAMALVANAVSRDLFGLDSEPVWLVLIAAICIGLALGGPVLVVRRWLERFGVYLALGAGAWLTVEALTAGDLGALWDRPGTELPFWLGVDLVVVMPMSWLPLVADYNRFSRPGARTFGPTYWSYFLGNVWFYALGAVLVLAVGATADVAGVGAAVAALAGGVVVLLVLLAGETDQAFANIYSAAVTVQNVVPAAPQRWLIGGVGALAFLLALVLTMQAYEFFLFLIGSVFVPLFGVFAADYFVRRRGRFEEQEMFGPRADRVRWAALTPWVLGFVVYQWSVPTEIAGWKAALERLFADWLGLPFPLFDSAAGASIPSFAVAFVLALLVPRRRRPVGQD